MKSLKISVGGKTFQIRSDAEPDYLRSLADQVNERFLAIKRSGSRQDQEFKAMSMIAIGLLDELTQTLESNEDIRTKAREFATRLIAKIDELLTQESS